MSLLELQQGIIYGPIDSRRLGRSLGLNIMPTTYKLCPFNCVYCHYGWTDIQALNLSERKGDLPDPEAVAQALRNALEEMSRQGRRPDYVTFSGNGEPTAHPRFAKIVETVRAVRDEIFPGLKIALLTNSTTLEREEICQAIGRVDRPIMKLDAGTEELFRQINRPVTSITLAQVVAGLKRLDRFDTQTVFMRGSVDNSTAEAVKPWMDLVDQVRPTEAQIYTVDRWPADPSLEKVNKERLQEIAGRTERETGVKVKVY
jgi:wyosine [tRNA(Phe)-imidazoG37] synthetase (radical SAM superfamily)